tara:strand:+ start:2009 stop:2458 length:450 start_codon:yes stop_codon:yes gene_type:complete
MEAGAIINKNKRYSLWRIWNQNLPKVLYVMLNPSLANNSQDDNTIKRLNYFTKKFGFGGFYVGNIYPHITPYPKILYRLNLHFSNKNNFYLNSMIKKSEKIVFAWGNCKERPLWIEKSVQTPFCFGHNKNGSPKHPLYLPKSTSLTTYF